MDKKKLDSIFLSSTITSFSYDWKWYILITVLLVYLVLDCPHSCYSCCSGSSVGCCNSSVHLILNLCGSRCSLSSKSCFLMGVCQLNSLVASLLNPNWRMGTVWFISKHAKSNSAYMILDYWDKEKYYINPPPHPIKKKKKLNPDSSQNTCFSFFFKLNKVKRGDGSSKTS